MNQSVEHLIQSTPARVERKQLQYMAYSGQFESVHSILNSLPVESRAYYSDKNILSQAIWGSVVKIKDYRSIHNFSAVKNETCFLTELLDQFIEYSLTTNFYPRELFQSILYGSDEFIYMSLYDEAMHYLQQAIDYGINKFPALRVDAINKIALINSNKGKIKDAASHLLDLAEHPYMITDRNQVPEILFRLSRAALKTGDIANYKNVLFLGIRYFYTNIESRRKFINQLKETYRHSFKLLLDSRVKLSDKFIYLMHRSYFLLPNLGKIKLGVVNKTFERMLIGTMYIFNYIKRSEPVRLTRNESTAHFPMLRQVNNLEEIISRKRTQRKKRILITRAMGGIGDLLMMTPGIHALKRKFPDREIQLAIPRRYFPVFKFNDDVKPVDIEEAKISHGDYSRWYNFTDCPASRSESRKAPKVKKTRINIFANALGIRGLRLLTMDSQPRYYISNEEKEFADNYFSELRLNQKIVIGVQLHSDETYRDFPLMETLVERLSDKYTILLFDSNKITGYDFNNVIKIDSFNIRQAFAIAGNCDLIIAPDSSFIHFAAALQIPTVALFGPIDGVVRTRHYPNCTFIDVRDELGCLPCWRNENIPCKLTGMRNSACMESIPVRKIREVIEQKINESKHEKS